ncbi:Hypothetical_protein [Hexamita inflata]|uniref:Hypothetical_protein n=1 Tax=Hexamita inflata TaxID=28002 RepID=A0AA86QNL7_9EUKA|nr:Hypothetical protein HINF_LOCUS50631 [Hexamita inflata]CAI9962988.1 Hypothetical protein HINF_LOCUS50633 [Hexamita inflata]
MSLRVASLQFRQRCCHNKQEAVLLIDVDQSGYGFGQGIRYMVQCIATDLSILVQFKQAPISRVPLSIGLLYSQTPTAITISSTFYLHCVHIFYFHNDHFPRSIQQHNNYKLRQKEVMVETSILHLDYAYYSSESSVLSRLSIMYLWRDHELLFGTASALKTVKLVK